MTSFTNVFGGSPIQTADVSYRKITLTKNPPTGTKPNPVEKLQWPSSFQDTNSVVSHIMEVESDDDSNAIWLPDATLASVGSDFMFSIVGPAKGIKIYNFNGTIINEAATVGQSLYYYLQDNTNPSGDWGVISLGIGLGVPGLLSLSETVDGVGLTIDPNSVTSPGGEFTFKLDDTLQNISKLTGSAKPSGSLFWNKDTKAVESRIMKAGRGVTIENEDGVNGPPIFNVKNEVDGINTIEINAKSLSIKVDGSPVKPPANVAKFTFSLAPSLESLYTIGNNALAAGFVAKTSSSTTPYVLRSLVPGNGILIDNTDGNSGNPKISLDPKFQIAAIGTWINGKFKNSLNVKSIKKITDTQFEIEFDSDKIFYKGAPFLVVMSGPVVGNKSPSWSIATSPITEKSTLFFSDAVTSFSFMAWVPGQ